MKTKIEHYRNAVLVERNSRGRIINAYVPLVHGNDKSKAYRIAAGNSRQHAIKIGSRYYLKIRADHLITDENGNQKIAKSNALSSRYMSVVLHLAQHELSGHNVCAQSHACKALCVGYNGKGQLPRGAFEHLDEREVWLAENIQHALASSVHRARIAKTRLLIFAPDLFLQLLVHNVARLEKRARQFGRTLLIRPNGTSDVPWEVYLHNGKTMFALFPKVRWYDYTKLYRRAVRALVDPSWPQNYDLTFSRDETNDAQSLDVLRRGGRIAMVVRTHEMSRLWGGSLARAGSELLKSLADTGIPNGQYSGFTIHNGDKSDLRHLESSGIVALYAKGRAARDNSGFAVTIA